MKKILLFSLVILMGFQATASELYEAIMAYQADRSSLSRKYSNPLSEEYFLRMEQLYRDWMGNLEALSYDSFSEDGKTDYLLFRNHLEKQSYFHNSEFQEYKTVAHVAGFSSHLQAFYTNRRKAKQPESPKLAAAFEDSHRLMLADWEKMKKSKPFESWQKAELAANVIAALRKNTEEAYNFYFDYDPEFTWWMQEPFAKVNKGLQEYEAFLKTHFENTVIKDDGSGIIGKPIGKMAIEKELEFEFINYSPEELIKEAEKQYAWCEKEMLKASNELGFGNDWKAALEMVKNTYVPAGVWPGMVTEMADEAIAFLEKYDLITVPELAKETWRTSMISAERQRVSPFFLGGEEIQISYPTSDMTHEEKMMSMRGNNPHFSRATVQHELIPGHHLQQFMNQRHHPHRRLFSTPFWTEGWALYWEFNLWDKDFPRSAEDRIGMLFWRMHRCARIVFSLNYHLGKMSPQECIDYLVEKVGHERANAEAEVRRSFTGRYGPLYQIAYMIGGLQFYALKAELVDTGKMTEKAFHDFIITQNTVPVELLRARIKGETLPKDYKSSWRFLD
ncbi:hypothetical protein P872_22420 [Rhodonellum psychrophilum GCM71 = DSM 17998]|uniref:X-Pro dipeptidyl-peptidase n=2 Tax=Rhodonellum TaxID=336827 RepID=U5C454_9BACT|nr:MULTISPECIES: DUF885 family protein [Rhodonellum]ERM84818.1 hypothetical protein P872_22420 [Rhodonellum psychrophilum GCM71 = DSM 17998]SDY70944.1 protein of unknown function [Rhodonellum ikkaensis]